MLSLETYAVLLELRESLALTFTHVISASLSGIHLDEGLEAELNSDGHEVRILYYLRICVGPRSSVPLHLSRSLFIDFDLLVCLLVNNLRATTHDCKKLRLFMFQQLEASCLFDPGHLFRGLLVHLHQGAA